MDYVTTTDGVKIAVYDLNQRGSKTIVLIHGWPLNHNIYEYQEEMLIKAGYRVILIDLRGFGQSDAPAHGYSYDRLAADIYEVVCDRGVKHFVLVGFSMGGAIVLRYMKNYQGYGVSKLVLLAAAAPSWVIRPGFPYGNKVEIVDQLLQLAETDRPKLCENFSQQLFAIKHSQALIKWFEGIALSASGIGTVQTGYALRDEDGREDLSSVKVPTAIFQGDQDKIVPNDLTEYQHAHIPGSRLYHLNNSGHGLMYDVLEPFNALLLGFLES